MSPALEALEVTLRAAPVVRPSAAIVIPVPVVMAVASISATTPVVCSESILKARALALATVLKSISNPILAALPALLPACAILTRLPALSFVADVSTTRPPPVVSELAVIAAALPVVAPESKSSSPSTLARPVTIKASAD